MANPIDMIKVMMKSKTPQQLAMNMINTNSNPMFSNLLNMAKTGNSQGLEQFARNICKQKGINYDTEFSNFMKQLKG